jgi:hypothetical protein
MPGDRSATRQRRREEGRCPTCGGPPEEGFVNCAKCRRRIARYGARAREREAAARTQYSCSIFDIDPSPAIRCRVALLEARARGLEFDEAWRPALRAALRPLRGKNRGSWKAVLVETCDAWCAAYEHASSIGPMASTRVPTLLSAALLDPPEALRAPSGPHIELIA